MKLNLKLGLGLLLGTFVISATPAHATRTESGYGGEEPFSVCAPNVALLDGGESFSNCIGEQTAPFTVDIGGTDYTVFQFAFAGTQNGDSTNTGGIYDLVDLGPVLGGTTIDLPVLNTGLLSGVMFCGNGTTAVASTGDTVVEQDSLGNPILDGAGNPINMPCTPDGSSISQSGEGFTPGSSVSDLTLFTLDGNLADTVPAAMPEPGSVVLLGMGLAGLVGLRRRRAA